MPDLGLDLPDLNRSAEYDSRTKIGRSAGQVIVALPDLVFPERLDLYQVLCPDARYRLAIKGAPHIDHRRHQLG